MAGLHKKVINKEWGFVQEMYSWRDHLYHDKQVMQGFEVYALDAFKRLVRVLRRDQDLLLFCIEESKKRQAWNDTPGFMSDFWRVKASFHMDDCVLSACLKEAIKRGYQVY